MQKHISGGVLFFVLLSAAIAADWPQFMRDAAHTGLTPDSPAPPYKLAWTVSFKPETVGTIQPIVYKDALFVPTLQGRLYAINPATGERIWVQDGLGTVSRTPAADAGLVYVANIEGLVHAVKTDRAGVEGKSGIAWTADLGFGISALPCVEGGRVYIGARNGLFFCLDGKTGGILWKTQLEGYVWSGAAVADGRVYVATDRVIRMHCLDANAGKELWKSDRLPGIFVRDWCPVIASGKVFMRSMPPEYRFFKPAPYCTWAADLKGEDFRNYQQDLRAGKLPEVFRDANEILAGHLKDNPDERTMFAFDAATGEVPYVCAVMQVFSQWFGSPAPPAVDADGLLQVPVPYAPSRFGRFDPKTGRIADVLVGDLPEGKDHDGLGTNSDESHGASCGGDRVFWIHFNLGGCDASLVYDIKTREIFDAPKGMQGGAKPPGISAALDSDTPASALKNLADATHQSGCTGPAIWENCYYKFSSGNFLYAVKGADGNGGGK